MNMTKQELLQKYFNFDGEDYRPKKGIVVKLDFFTVDYISFVGDDMAYSMASDNKYNWAEIDINDIKIYSEISK